MSIADDIAAAAASSAASASSSAASATSARIAVETVLNAGAFPIIDSSIDYPTRALFVAANGETAGVGLLDGQVARAGGFQYRRLAASTAISDLPGWVPNGDATPQHFGAVEGAADNYAALQAWLDAIKSGFVGAGSGTFDFDGTLTLTPTAILRNVQIKCDGLILRYVGANATRNLLQLGGSAFQGVNWRIEGLRATSNTTMTAGTAILVERVMRSFLQGFIAGDSDASGNCWDGIYFKNCDNTYLEDWFTGVQNEGVTISGAAGIGAANVFIDHGRAAFGAVGIHIAGGMGGVVIGGGVDAIQNYTNLKISTERSAEVNRELFFDHGAFFDGTTGGPSVHITDTVSTGASWFSFSSPWIASGDTDCLLIDADVQARIHLNGGTVFNSSGDGIKCNSSTARLFVHGTAIRNNVGTGINFTVANSLSDIIDPVFIANGTNFAGIRPISVQGGGVRSSWADLVEQRSLSAAPLFNSLSASDAGTGWAQHFRRARGSLDAPTDVLDADRLGDVTFYGYQGADWRVSSRIMASALAPTGTFTPGRLQLLVADAGGVLRNRMELTDTGPTFPTRVRTDDSYHVAGNKVVGARQAAISNATGGTEIATVNAILAAMRAHGLIAP